MTPKTRLGAATAVLLAGIAGARPVAAEVDIHGFVEGAWGVRVVESPVHPDGAYTMEETRAQLRTSAYGSIGEAFVRLDLVQDPLAAEGTDLELREAFLRFTTLGDHLDVKAGRQALTWGTGDLIFVNDLFPKDWESFFAGRDDQYLKAPSDAIRIGVFGLPFDVDAVVTPRFEGDRLPAPGGRFSIGMPPGVTGAPASPPPTAENAELAVRLSRYVGDVTVAAYGYRGFFKTPDGVTASGAFGLVPFHPELSVYGASARGSLLGGVAWVEYGWYDSRSDRDGDDPRVPNGSHRYLAGWERQLLPDFNVTVQYYGERLQDVSEDELAHLVTARVEKLLRYQTVRLSLFGFHDPERGDSYLRGLAGYDFSDDVELVVGANVFRGLSTTRFGAFDADDNVYTRLRYSF